MIEGLRSTYILQLDGVECVVFAAHGSVALTRQSAPSLTHQQVRDKLDRILLFIIAIT